MMHKRNWAGYCRQAERAIQHDQKAKRAQRPGFLVTTVYEKHGVQYTNTFQHPVMSIHTYLDMLERGEIEEVRITPYISQQTQ